MSNIDKRATELLIENGELVADTLRHLADNEIDSDYFAICHTNENGTEIECELAITDYARQAAGTVDELVKALEAAEKRIAEMQARSAPHAFNVIAENIRTQDNRVTSDPMFCVYQKREIVAHEDYDHDRIVWIDEDGNEATERQRRRLELLHENFRDTPEKWRRVAVKEIDEFVTCCFSEKGCKDYLECNGHNLRLPFIYVKSGFRNAEYIGIRNWLSGIRINGEG